MQRTASLLGVSGVRKHREQQEWPITIELNKADKINFLHCV
jgi:hypothetical protein